MDSFSSEEKYFLYIESETSLPLILPFTLEPYIFTNKKTPVINLKNYPP